MGKTYKDREKKDNISRVNHKGKEIKSARMKEFIFDDDFSDIMPIKGMETIYIKMKNEVSLKPKKRKK
jgi:hypothetical protein